MQKKFVSTLPVFVASMLAATNLVGAQQPCTNGSGSNANCRPQKTFDQGRELAAGQMPAAYNAPARIEVRGAWDFWVDASYILWQPIEDNLEFAGVSPTADTTVTIAGESTIVKTDFDFKSGFKVGAGMNFGHDSWSSWVEYTWFHNTNKGSTNQGTVASVSPMWLHPQDVASTDAFVSASSKWKLQMDLLDWALGRAYYVGQNLTFLPFFGARAAWIHQQFIANYTTASALNATGTYKSTSWGLGLETGLNTNWLLGMGFRMFGNAEADLLYTRYNIASEVGGGTSSTLGTVVLTADEHSIDTVRPHVDLELGFGYGTYFDNNNWHFDMTLGYGFQVFWNQNMFRRFISTHETFLSDLPLGDLYVHGMTLTARLDF